MDRRSLLGAAILLASILDFGFCQHRRVSSRAAAIGADVKTVVNFDCPEEFGYYPHPSDCTQYYVCVFGGALLESCTGGLMYSHELQTCDWPRNVGCDGAEIASSAPTSSAISSSSRTRGGNNNNNNNNHEESPREVTRSRYTPPTPQPPQPAAVVTSRGQPRQLHHNQQEIVKQRQQQQLYADAEEQLPPAEEVENDRQQRVYRGQPSSVGQVQKDRDGLRHSNNAIPTFSGRSERERIGVISFGTQQLPQQQQQYSTINHDLLTNDLTLKRRRKRQTQHSRTRPPESWRQPASTTATRSSATSHNTRFATPLTLQPPPIIPIQNLPLAPNHHQHYHQQRQPQQPLYVSPSHLLPLDNQEFKPFVPVRYQTAPLSHTIAKQEPYSPLPVKYNYLGPSSTTTPSSAYENDFSYFTITAGSSTAKPIIQVGASNIQTSKITDSPLGDNYNDNYVVVPQYTHIDHNTSSIQISNPNIRHTTPQVTSDDSSKENYNDNEDIKTTTINNDYHTSAEATEQRQSEDLRSEEETDYRFGPPPSYFETKNKYENIENPFASPNFDFDTFLANLRGDRLPVANSNVRPKTVKKDEENVVQVVRPPPVVTRPSQPPKKIITNNNNLIKTKIKQPLPPNEYYYYDEAEVRTTPRAIPVKKLYSSQIKPKVVTTLATTLKPLDDDYYYEEYDYPEQTNVNKDKNYQNNDASQSQRVVAVPNNITGEQIKYSAKYHDKPQKIQKFVPLVSSTTTYRSVPKQIAADAIINESYNVIPTYSSSSTTFRTTTSDSNISTTTKPRYNIRQRPTISTTTTTTRPSRGKNRQRLTDDDSTRLRVEQSSVAPVQASISPVTATARTLYNSTQYNNNNNNNNYDPYYALYDDEVELYRDSDYSQQYNGNSNNNAAQSRNNEQAYRRTPAPAVQSTTTQEEPPKRGNSVYIQNNYNQDIYQQPATVSDYNEDNSYNSQLDDSYNNRQINRQPSRGDRNDLNYLEEATTKRITTTSTTTARKPTSTTRTTTTTSTTPRTIPLKKSTVSSRPANENKTQAQSIINTLREGPGQDPEPYPSSSLSHLTSLPSSPSLSSYSVPLQTSNTGQDSITYRPKLQDTLLLVRQPSFINAAVVNKPAPFTLPKHLTNTTTEKPIVFHYITKPSSSSRSTSLVSSTTTELVPEHVKYEDDREKKIIIVPTTYSPPKFFLKSLLPKTSIVPSYQSQSNHKTLKAVRKLISPVAVNHELASSTFESNENLSTESNIQSDSQESASSTAKIVTSSTTQQIIQDYIPITDNRKKIRHFVEPDFTSSGDYTPSSNATKFRTTVEIPPPRSYLIDDDDYQPKQEPDQSPDYKLKPINITTTTSTSTTPAISTTSADSYSLFNTSSVPVRVSRVNTAIKALIAFGGTRKQNIKCHENPDSKCNDPKRRTNTRGRGSAHYATGGGGSIANNEVTVAVNRGTPASRSRPTLKPSTAIVSKATEFIDIYRFPPIRPDPIYPQPQPDKTAAKCRKDVCLLPDCSCGGKEIPGDIPVEQVPQIVLLTFDDSVNDLNKGLYSDLFEKGRTNPNGCPISATFYVSHEWTDYSQVQNLYSDGHEIASHTVSHSFGEQFSQKKWTREVAGQREILSAYGGVHLEDVRGMRAPFLSVGGNKMFKMLYDSNFTYDSSMPIYENKPPSWPYTLDYKLFHDCMIPPCPTRSYPGVWEVPMVMWQDLNGGRCSMGDACSNPPEPEGVFKMLTKNFQRHYTTNRAPFGLFYHAAWFTQPHHKEGFINFLDSILAMKDVWVVTNWQAIQWIRDPTPTSRLGSFQAFQCDFSDRPKRCNNPKVCNLWHKSGVRYMRTCQPCPDIYPWTGNTGIRSSRIDNDIED